MARMMNAAVSAAWLLVTLSQAVHIFQSAPGSPSSAEATAGPKVGWDLCAVPHKGTDEKVKSPIPRILHQTYKTTNLPPELHQSYESWRQVAPGWERHLWTDADNRELIATHYPWFLSTYDSYPYPIERSDAARYFTLHRYGGVYADLDIEALRDPELLISGKHDLMMFYDWATAPESWTDPWPWSGSGEGITNALMASAPGHEFWMYVGEQMLKSKLHSDAWVAYNPDRVPGKEKLEKTFWATGPWFITLALNDYMKKRPEAHAGITAPKYWQPSPIADTGGLQIECEDRAACMKLFPDAILYHHSLGRWIWQKETSMLKLSRKWGKASCSRDEWNSEFGQLRDEQQRMAS